MNVREMFSRYRTISSEYGIRLKKAWDTIWKVLTFNLIEGVVIPKKCLSISVEKSAVSAAYGTLFLSRPHVKGFRTYLFDESKYAGPENLASAASWAIDGLKASGADIILSMPREFLVVRTAELPLVVKENITSVMSYELDRLTPFTSSEALYDFKIYDEEDEKLKVIVVAIRTDALKPYLDALKEKNIRPVRITASATSLGTLCGALEKTHDALCVLINEEGYEGCLTKRGVVASTFYGTFSGHDRESNLNHVAENILPLLNQLKDKDISPVVFLCPVEGYTMLQEKIGVPVRIFRKDDMKSMFKTTGNDIVFTPLGGLLEALRPGTNGFNLMSKGVKEVKRVPVGLTIILLSIIVAMIIPHVYVPYVMEKSKLRGLDAQIASRKGEIKKIEALKKEINTLGGEITRIKEFKESRPMALNIMKELTTVLPNTVWLTRTRITEETVEIEGYASTATELLTKLEKSPLFQKVEFTSPTIRDTRLNTDRFVIKMEIEGLVKKQVGGDKNEK
jgi:general secretion pathway protein L